MRTFRPCSGQSGRGVLPNPRKNDWAICRDDGPLSWRAMDKAGRLRTFPTFEAAERAALKLELELIAER